MHKGRKSSLDLLPLKCKCIHLVSLSFFQPYFCLSFVGMPKKGCFSLARRQKNKVSSANEPASI